MKPVVPDAEVLLKLKGFRPGRQMYDCKLALKRFSVFFRTFEMSGWVLTWTGWKIWATKFIARKESQTNFQLSRYLSWEFQIRSVCRNLNFDQGLRVPLRLATYTVVPHFQPRTSNMEMTRVRSLPIKLHCSFSFAFSLGDSSTLQPHLT